MDALEGGVPDIMEHGRALGRMLQRGDYHGILYDSQISFLGASGVSENDAHEGRNWTIAASGVPCVIILDHTGHADGTRSRGTSDKGAGCDVDILLKRGEPFAIERPGSVSLVVNKDRSGTLAIGSSIEITVECLDPDGMDFKPENWSTAHVGYETTIAETVDLIMLDTGRDFVTASELQAKLVGSKPKRLDLIRNAVDNGEIYEAMEGRVKRYTAA
jgi:hypothetical protein